MYFKNNTWKNNVKKHFGLVYQCMSLPIVLTMLTCNFILLINLILVSFIINIKNKNKNTIKLLIINLYFLYLVSVEYNTFNIQHL
jgi:hypothetical protein